MATLGEGESARGQTSSGSSGRGACEVKNPSHSPFCPLQFISRMRFKGFQPGQWERFYLSIFTKSPEALTILVGYSGFRKSRHLYNLWSLMTLTCQP